MATVNIPILTPGYSFEYERFGTKYFVIIKEIFTHHITGEYMYKVRREYKPCIEGSHGLVSEEILNDRDMNELLKFKEESDDELREWHAKILMHVRDDKPGMYGSVYSIMTKYVRARNKEEARTEVYTTWFDPDSIYYDKTCLQLIDILSPEEDK